ncbi:uncharacterized protein V1516DRAFT_682789 [Lipomyces oligophaga]|uniref:uncharacterized protein n=1 Tax=Lipomyces oligophaga TaxID=45792 RepID=UPI0034CD7A32
MLRRPKNLLISLFLASLIYVSFSIVWNTFQFPGISPSSGEPLPPAQSTKNAEGPAIDLRRPQANTNPDIARQAAQLQISWPSKKKIQAKEPELKSLLEQGEKKLKDQEQKANSELAKADQQPQEKQQQQQTPPSADQSTEVAPTAENADNRKDVDDDSEALIETPNPPAEASENSEPTPEGKSESVEKTAEPTEPNSVDSSAQDAAQNTQTDSPANEAGDSASTPPPAEVKGNDQTVADTVAEVKAASKDNPSQSPADDDSDGDAAPAVAETAIVDGAEDTEKDLPEDKPEESGSPAAALEKSEGEAEKKGRQKLVEQKLTEQAQTANKQVEQAAEVALDRVEKAEEATSPKNQDAPALPGTSTSGDASSKDQVKEAPPAKNDQSTQANSKQSEEAKKEAEKKKSEALAAYFKALDKAKKEKAQLAQYLAALYRLKKKEAAEAASVKAAEVAKKAQQEGAALVVATTAAGKDKKPSESLPAIEKGSLPGQLRVALTDTAGMHDDVVSALAYAFSKLPNSNIYQYISDPRFNVFSLLKSFGLDNLAVPRSTNSMVFHQWIDPVPDIMVGATCESDFASIGDKFSSLLEAGTFYFCVVHRSDWWNSDSPKKLYEKVSPWIDRDQIKFLFLSGHTKRFMEEKIVSTWSAEHQAKANALFEVFVPVFPTNNKAKPLDKEIDFSLQGNYESKTVNFKNLFAKLEDIQNRMPVEEKIRLHLIGSGQTRPEVPDPIFDQVEFNESLEFLEFYTVLANSAAVMSAFDTEDYYDRKASSLVSASLIAGTPIISTPRLMQAYDYLTDDIVWKANDGEEPMDVVDKIVLQTPKETIVKQKEAVISRRDVLIKENIDKVGTWAKTIEYKVVRWGNEWVREGWSWDWSQF